MPRQVQTLTLGDLLAQTGMFSKRIPVRVIRRSLDDEPVAAAVVSLLVPVHNQEAVIVEHLEAMRSCACLPHEIVVVPDGCTDATAQKVADWAAALPLQRGHTVGVTVAEVSESIFETNSDNLAASLASAPYLVEVQADMRLEHPGFDSALVAGLDRHPELFALSGRGAHAFHEVLPPSRGVLPRLTGLLRRTLRRAIDRRAFRRGSYRPNRFELFATRAIGRCGALIDLPLAPEVGSGRVYVSDTVMRGPLAMRRQQFWELGGFSSEHFFLGNDDHDLMARARDRHGLRGAYVPIRFSAPLELGSVRRERTAEEKERFAALSVYYAEAGARSFLFADTPRSHPKRPAGLRSP